MNLTHDVTTNPPVGGATRQVLPRRIFVAEDDDDTRTLVVTAFVEDGHDVVGLRDGAELLECLDMVARDALRAPDLLAMGAGVAGRSEIELLERIRRSGWQTPTVVMSWIASSRMRARVDLAAPAALLTKPFNMAELRRTSSRVLARAESFRAGVTSTAATR
jgi:DNA-binding response OmpR family regulator